MAKETLLVVVLIFLAAAVVGQRQRTECCEEYCYGTDSERQQSERFASKSVYQIVRGVDMSRHSVIPSEYIHSFQL